MLHDSYVLDRALYGAKEKSRAVPTQALRRVQVKLQLHRVDWIAWATVGPTGAHNRAVRIRLALPCRAFAQWFDPAAHMLEPLVGHDPLGDTRQISIRFVRLSLRDQCKSALAQAHNRLGSLPNDLILDLSNSR